MLMTFSRVGRALAPIALATGLFALPGLASAGAVTSATAVALFELVEADPDITVTYEFFTADTVFGTSTTGNAIASVLQTPDSDIDELLFFVDQDAQSQAEAYKTVHSDLGAAEANLSNEATIVLDGTNSTTGGTVTLGWEYTLEAIQQVTGIHDFASALAYAQIVMFDNTFTLDIDESIQALYDGEQSMMAADGGEISLTVPAGGFNFVTVQLITEAEAQFVPVPATAGLLVLGLLGLRTIRRRAA
ncbi:MAG: hypothetical protein N838_31015 [Thiohalocapsa sp. PB-PSB1]|jgi:hypothetical protein|nr:MAG: hypothetical protein N838_22395 [Thiohalocapsa sp. PB-PSB1]QQO57124.1 MAG: hypothetical protein N838_31015 [Thiohalocapsa sp. PB-PSB1]HCS90779.1 hypothetical protein [Chromatiaceae bacterium]